MVSEERRLDLPEFGRPIIPISAIIFNCNHVQNFSPFPPLVFFLGALFTELLNLTFPSPPLPPFAITNS